MNVLFILIPLGLVLLALAIAAFFWAVGSGQFDDLDSPGTLVLFDEEAPARTPTVTPPSAAASGVRP